MVQAIAGETALKGRKMIKSGGTGEEHWRTDFLGKRADGEIKDHQPQAFLIEMSANEVIVPHFHEVDQFQVFVPATDAPLAFIAGPKGLEALLLQFARNSPGPVPTNS